MRKNKSFNSVSQMIRDLSDRDFADTVEERLAERQIVKHLMALRAKQELSQEEMAKKLKCSQSKISKFESAKDGDIRLDTLVKYLDAMDMQPQFIFMPKKNRTVNEIKFHFCQMKRLMKTLSGMAIKDEAIAKGIADFFSEAAFNFITMLVESAKDLPSHVRESTELIKVLSGGDQDYGKEGTTELCGEPRDKPAKKSKAAKPSEEVPV